MFIKVDKDTCPTVNAAKETIARLRKDISILEKYPRSGKDENPDSLKEVVSFLESLLFTGKNILND